MINVVYMMTFPNSMRYVGVTTDFVKRIRSHKHLGKINYETKNKKAVHEAIKKFGPENVNVKILGRFGTFQQALRYEVEMIQAFDSRNFGYNLTNGGEGCYGSTEIHEKIAKKLGAKPFVALKDGKIVGTWINMSACARELGIHRPNITHCLNGKLRKTGGYVFKFADK